MNAQTQTASAATEALAGYIVHAGAAPLPQDVRDKTRHHILDTLAAILSGAHLRAGRLSATYVSRFRAVPEASVLGTVLKVPVEYAALANGMAGHGDETDDSHLAGRFHPGCGVVPAALAIAEHRDVSGAAFLHAVTLGYDIGARLTMSLGFVRPDTTRHSPHSLGTNFGAAAAAASLMNFDTRQVRHVLSYAAQQASGVPFWNRDHDHVEKAFDFGGMGARNGVSAAMMVAAGCTAVEDAFAGPHTVFTAFGEQPLPEVLTDGLGARFEIMAASIKKWCVGSPIQAILDATTALIDAHHLTAADIAAVRIIMPDDRMHIVDDRDMPDVCAQHLVALAIVDGTVGFTACHDGARMHDPAIRAVRERTTLLPSAELTAAVPARQAIVEMDLTNGESVRHHAMAVRGTPDNPMTADEIIAKARDLIAPVIGMEKTDRVVAAVAKLETLESIRPLVAVMTNDS